MGALEKIFHMNIDLGPVECTVYAKALSYTSVISP